MLNQCEWSGPENAQCSNTSDWRHVSEDKYRRRQVWKLCDGHKRMWLDGYNEATRIKETPEWSRL